MSSNDSDSDKTSQTDNNDEQAAESAETEQVDEQKAEAETAEPEAAAAEAEPERAADEPVADEPVADEPKAEAETAEPEAAAAEPEAAAAEPEAAAEVELEPAAHGPAPAADDEADEPEPPVIESVEPDHGPLAGVTDVTIHGAAFSDGCTVQVGNQELSVSFNGEEQLSVTVRSAEQGGPVDLKVVNPDGKTALRVNAFHYDHGPEISAIEPTVLSAAGGGSFFVRGAHFSTDCKVQLGENELAPVKVEPDCLELCAPEHEAGPVDVVVTNPDGQSATAAAGLTFDEGPVLESVEPPVGPLTGGTELIIKGRNFKPACSVSLFDAYSPAVEYDSDTQLRITTPPHQSSEAGSLGVQNPDGLADQLAEAFRYAVPEPPQINELSEADAYVTGGKRVVLSGANFLPGCAVLLGEAAAEVTLKDDTTVEFIVPPGSEPGKVDVVLRNPDDQEVILEGGFEYRPVPAPPKLIKVEPNQGFVAGGLTIALIGDNFDERTVVRIGEVQATIEKVSQQRLEVITPPREQPGAVAVELTNRDGVLVRVDNAFTYQTRSAAEIADVEPNEGPCTGGTRVTIEGTNLTSNLAVRIGRERAKLLRVKSESVMLIETPAHKLPGIVDVTLVGPDGSKIVKEKAFKYKEHPAPKIESVAPNRCGTNGKTEVTIEGQNFVANSAVYIGRTKVENVKLVDAKTLEFKAPPGKHGQMVDVQVRNPDWKKDIAKRAFVYDERYG